MSESKKKPIKVDFVCYTGFTTEELEYIDYTRTVAEEGEESGNNTWEFYRGSTTNLHTQQDELHGDGDTNETGFDDMYPSVEELRSYMCSTPSRRRRSLNPEYFAQDANISRISDTDFPGRNRRARSESVISLFDDRGSIRSSLDSLVNLRETHEDQYELEEIKHGSNLKKIDLDSDLKDPYCVNIDDLEISIEEEEEATSKANAIVSLRRRMSQKLSRRNPSSMGFFGSYLPRNQALPPSQNGQSTTDHRPQQSNPGRGGGTRGPLNFWFRKFRNRHFI